MIVHGRPPNFEQIREVFPRAALNGTIFAYWPDIYVSSGRPLPAQLVAHESVHLHRQSVYLNPDGRDGTGGWWDQYLHDGNFRYTEELLAHVAEYRQLVTTAPNRQLRRAALKQVAVRFANPLYRLGLTTHKAALALQEMTPEI